MAGVFKFLCFVTFIVIAGIERVQSAGRACNADATARMLMPCMGAAMNGRVRVPPACCSRIKAIRNPSCLCAALFSRTAKRARINLAIAVTIPKRCNLKHRPYKCGRYIVP